MVHFVGIEISGGSLKNRSGLVLFLNRFSGL